MSTQYEYKGLVGLCGIRLLRLLSSNNTTAPIHCQLLDYTLNGAPDEDHLFDALSYCWDSPEKTHSISINSLILPITSNLHAALSHLRNRSFDRILWIDAVCINQADEHEKAQQIGLMYIIYSYASCVHIWLGNEANNSIQAIKALRITGRQGAADTLNDKHTQDVILQLLKRNWFRRIWVLQEVAAARRIQILCGRSRLDGYAFCLAMDSIGKSLNRSLELYGAWNTIQSVLFLMRGAILRPQDRSSSERIRPLCELVDMYHQHEATEAHDKVYALLGMCTNNISKSRLSVDYSVPFHKLLHRVVQFTLSKDISVETKDNQKVSVITSKIYVLGAIQSVEEDMTASYQQRITVIWNDISGSSKFSAYHHASWTLQASAIPLQRGDVVCLYQNATRPMVIRLYQDFAAVLVIAARPPASVLNEGAQYTWSKILSFIRLPLRDAILIWDWYYTPEEYSRLNTYLSWAQEIAWTTQESGAVAALDETTRLFGSGLILLDSRAFGEANIRFQKGIMSHKRAMGLVTMEAAHPNDISLSSLNTPNHFGVNPDQLHFRDPGDSIPILTLHISALLAWAIEEGHELGARHILDSGNIYSNFRDKNGITLLRHAARSGHLDIVEWLLQEQADVNAAAAEWKGRTTLQGATERGHRDIVKWLLQNHAAATNYNSGRTALQAAAEGGHLAIVERLLQEQADVNAAADYSEGRTALQAAAEGGHLAIVKRLLQEQADVNAAAVKWDGRTALQAAAKGGHFAIVERLLQKQADINAAAAGYNGRTALQAATEGGHLAIVERLKAAGALS